uniref:Uncharacterized protein n=1 Tax=Cairina moschata TaxID=8855 RepID=A0A8C3CBG8_CAIMO
MLRRGWRCPFVQSARVCGTACVCPSVCLSVSASECAGLCLSVSQCEHVGLRVCPSVSQSVCLSVSASMRDCLCPSVRQCQSARGCVSQCQRAHCVCPSVRPPVSASHPGPHAAWDCLKKL